MLFGKKKRKCTLYEIEKPRASNQSAYIHSADELYKNMYPKKSDITYKIVSKTDLFGVFPKQVIYFVSNEVKYLSKNYTL